ncbi:hypothetical protein SAY87_004174 [Trapa incisa]|uniref:DUF3444 domain-containing protein n=1 Tax=Trapa incisa TaxID=236973 RepID=A0AAN7PJW9_9MYRT|nr:hypothetical protein SAY87_004174 [Trapa incisa]
MKEINPNGKFSVPQNSDHFYDPGSSSQNFSTRDCTGANDLSGSSAPPPPYKTTFWTACNSCKVQFEFLARYVNCHLRCPNCRLSFIAVEVLPPPISNNDLFASSALLTVQKNSSKMMRGESVSSKELPSGKAYSMGSCYSDLSDKSGPSYKVLPQLGNAITSPSPTYSAMCLRSTYGSDLTRRTCISMHTDRGLSSLSPNGSFTSRVEAGGPRKKRRSLDQWMKNGVREDIGSHLVTGIGAGGRATETGSINIDGGNCSKSLTELSPLKTRILLIQRAKTEIRNKLSECNVMKRVANELSSSKKVKEQHEGLEDASSNRTESNFNRVRVTMDIDCADQSEKTYCSISTMDMEADSVTNRMSVPDSDFYDFDKNRVESSFRSNQIWAVYDDDDGMPRYYALIHKLISAKPFKIRISWLNSKTNLEFSPLKWVESGFPKACGDLRIGKSEVYGSLNSFSHRMKWTKGPRGIIRIYPLKGDIWALYRNWSHDWNVFTSDEVIHSYDMVEVLEDYSEDRGANVAPLVKVPGFRTVFRKHWDPSKIWKVPREEMFRFSHQVPSHKLLGQEATHAPRGCWELDPASTPLELLQVVSECSKQHDMLIGPRMPKGEFTVNGNACAEDFSKKDAENNKLEEAVKADRGVQGKELMVYVRRRKGRKRGHWLSTENIRYLDAKFAQFSLDENIVTVPLQGEGCLKECLETDQGPWEGLIFADPDALKFHSLEQ